MPADRDDSTVKLKHVRADWESLVAQYRGAEYVTE